MLLKLAFTMLFALIVSTVFAQNTNTATTQLYALFDAEWELNLRDNPTFASFLGDKRSVLSYLLTPFTRLRDEAFRE